MSTKTKTYEECISEVSQTWEGDFNHGLKFNKAVADLYASEKIKRAIELARTGQMPIGWTYNEQEILELLNK